MSSICSHVGGPGHGPGYEGVRTGSFRKAKGQKEIQIAVPEVFETTPEEFLARSLEEGLALAELYFSRKHKGVSLDAARQATLEVVAQLRGNSDLSRETRDEVRHAGSAQEMLDDELRHLAVGHETHFHVVVATDNEDEWDLPRLVMSPPYRESELAGRDARDPQLRAKVPKGFGIQVLECSRACPRSALGHFGWDDEEAGSFRWWDTTSWKVSTT